MDWTRRRLLYASSTTLALAGCLSGGGGGADGGDGNGDNDGDDGGDGGSGDGMDSPTTSQRTTTGSPTDAESDPTAETESDSTVRVSAHPELGDVLVDADGMTLYMFDNDEQGDASSTCEDDCAAAWPPLEVDGEPSAGDGVSADLTTFERDDGTTQVAANGWPLYGYAPDEEPGDATGQGANDVWWVLDPDGEPIRS